jgi:hypothetical protein
MVKDEDSGLQEETGNTVEGRWENKAPKDPAASSISRSMITQQDILENPILKSFREADPLVGLASAIYDMYCDQRTREVLLQRMKGTRSALRKRDKRVAG